jgi:hypothetical protein
LVEEEEEEEEEDGRSILELIFQSGQMSFHAVLKETSVSQTHVSIVHGEPFIVHSSIVPCQASWGWMPLLSDPLGRLGLAL